MLFFLFLIAIIIQGGFVLNFFARIFVLNSKEILAPATQGVSIIICAKNEAANLRKNLPAILAQQYSGPYEVIVVNDASTDDTAIISKQLGARCIDAGLPGEARDLKGKKHALSKGVAAARYDWLLLTDADCAPASYSWLAQMVAPLAAGKEIVAGYGAYNAAPGLLNAFIRWETLHSFLQYSTYALAGMPYMAVGRNMACTKSVLLRAQASNVWNQLPSGDDDLLVSICGNKHNVAIVATPSAFTYSHAKTTWRHWAMQKQRHLSTGKYYKGHIKLLQGAYGFAHSILWLSWLLLLFTPYRAIASLLFAARCLVYWAIWWVAAGRLKEKSLLYLFPLFDIGWMIYNFAFFPYITWKNKQQWK